MAMLTAAAISFASCEKDPESPAPEGPATPPEQTTTVGENTFTVNDSKYEFKSVAVGQFMDYPIIAATPTDGISSYEDIIAEENVFYIFLTDGLIGKEFDLMTETKDYGLYLCHGEDIYVEMSPDYKEDIKEGSAIVTATDGVMSATVSLTLGDGTKIQLNATAEIPVVKESTGTISWNGEKKPVRAAFYETEAGMLALYFTPGEISWFDEISEVTSYAVIGLMEAQCNGTDLDAGDLLFALYEDFLGTYASSEEVTVTGTVNVLADPSDPTYYKVSASLDFAGETLEITYDGYAVNTKDEAPVEQKANEYTLDGKTVPLAYATLNQTFGDLWMLELYPENGNAVRITMPKEFYDGNPHGFSQSESMKVVIGSRTFNKANGDSGTVTVLVNEDRGEIEASFTDYAGCNVYFKGGASIVK